MHNVLLCLITKIKRTKVKPQQQQCLQDPEKGGSVLQEDYADDASTSKSIQTQLVAVVLPANQSLAVSCDWISKDYAVRRIHFSPGGKFLAISCARKLSFILEMHAKDFSPSVAQTPNTQSLMMKPVPLKHEAAVKELLW
jgi:hypothetical protein